MKTRYIIELLLALLIGYLIYLIMLPFFVPIFWAAIFVILFYPYHSWLLRRVHNRTLTALLACATIALFLIVPMALIGTALVHEILNLYGLAEGYLSKVSMNAESPALITPYIQRYIGPYVDIQAIDIQRHILNAIQSGSSYLTSGLTGAIKNFSGLLFNTLLAFFTMYFLFKDADNIMAVVRDLIPLTEEDKDEVLAKNRVVITATFNGGVFVGAIQGILGGAAFWFLALPSPILWGFIMFILSFLPVVGTSLVIVPAAIYLLITGSYIKALMMILWGVFIVGLADNFLRPVIVSGKTHQHPLLLFFSILGAVNTFGLVGIIAGPIILSLAQAILDIYRSALKEQRAGTT
jgi:predicted PurR-regulated permease PerM